MTRLGSYTVDKPLGESPIGLAFAASHVSAPKLNGRFELVRIRATLLMQPEVEDVLADCARKIPHIDHGNLVRVFEVELNEDAGGPYVVSERRSGRTLDDVMKMTRSQGRSLPRPVAVAIAREVLRGLAHLHANPTGAVVHGGVHPRMVVIGSHGDVRLGGLVAARVIAAASSEEPELLRGCFGYVAPEVALGDPVDPRTDVYAAGVLTYQLVTGVLPPEGVVTPAELDDVIAKALLNDPAHRYPDARAFLAALDGVLDRAGAAHIAGSDITVFLAELFGEDVEAAEAALPPPRMPLAAPKTDGRGKTIADLMEDETTHVADAKGERSDASGEFHHSPDTLARETDDLLALLGPTPGSDVGKTPGPESTGVDTESRGGTASGDDSTTLAGFTEGGGRTYIPAPAVEHTPDVLPQGRLRQPTDAPLVVLSSDDDPALDERTPVVDVQLTPSPAPVPAPEQPAPKPSIFPNAGTGQVVSLTPIAGVPMLAATPAPAPARKAGDEKRAATPSPVPIQAAMAAARAMAQSPKSGDTDSQAALDALPPPREAGGSVMLYLTVATLVAALLAVLWFKTDVFHPSRKRARQAKHRLEQEARKKAAEARRPKAGRVSIQSTPSEAAVYWLLGRAPTEVPHLDSRGQHTIVVEHDGYDRVLRVLGPADFAIASATTAKPPVAPDTHLADLRITLPPSAAKLPEPRGRHDGKKAEAKQPAAVDAGASAEPPSGPPVLGTLRIDTTPAGALVWMLVGYTGSMALSGLPAEVEHQFRIEADGVLPAYVVVKPGMWSGTGVNLSYDANVTLEAVPVP